MPQKTSDIKLDSTNLFLFIGPADSGKSFAATSWGLKSKEFGGNDDRPAYMLELDGRVAALRDRPVQYDSFTNIEGAIGVLNRVKDLRETCVKFNKAPFHTLIFDSFTTFNDFAIADSQDITIKHNELSPKDPKGRRRGDLQMLTMEDYGYEAESWRQLMYEGLFDLKRFCDVIVIAHEVATFKKASTSKPGEPVEMVSDGYKILSHGNKIAARIPTKFDEIYHFLPKEKVISQRSLRRQVCFVDELGRTAYPELAKSTENYDISGKQFYTWWREKIEGNGKK